MVDDRSQTLVSQTSVHQNSVTDGAHGQSTDRAQLFKLFLVRPEQVDELWDSPEPNMYAQNLLLEHIEEFGEATQQDLMSWNENENRFEPNELKWIADFVVGNLVFVKKELKINDQERISFILEILWKTLDLFDESQTDLQGAMSMRVSKLQGGLMQIFAQGIVNKAQVGQILAHARRTIFSHLQLYITCMSMRKQETSVKRIEIYSEVPQMCSAPDLETDCKEIVEEKEESQVDLGAMSDEDKDFQNAEDDEEIFDPNDPLYGLDERLANLTISQESKQMLKQKLIGANNKIKEGLENRQKDLEEKMQNMPPAGATKKR